MSLKSGFERGKEVADMRQMSSGYLSFRGALVWLALFMGLLFTALLTLVLHDQRKLNATQQFELQVGDLVQAIEKRLRDHEQILLGAAGLINASPALVSREQWRTYVSNLKLPERYPGIQGVGFSLVLMPEQLDAHVASLRGQGFPDYSIRPSGERELYTSIIYLEPFVGRNLAAFGFDMYSESVRRAAMQQAVNANATTITGKVKLVQETHGKEQAGFLMYVPVYHPMMPQDSAQNRRQALLGFVYSPYRMGDLMQGILGGSDLVLDYTLHDGESGLPETLMYDSAVEHGEVVEHDPLYWSTRTIDAYGKEWTFTLRSRPAFQQQFESPLDWLIPMLGTVVSFSLFALIASLLGRRERAMALAEDLSARRIAENLQAETSLQEQADHTQAILDNMVDGIITINELGIIQSVNPAALAIFGYDAADMEGRNVSMLMPQPHRDAHDGYLSRYLQTKKAQIIGIGREVEGLRKDGSLFPMDLVVSEITRQGKQHFVGMVRDISEHKRIERMKTEFIATVSHELRTPLTAISGALGLVVGGVFGELPGRSHELLTIAHKNGQQLHLLINDLLDMEKLAAGQMRFDMQVQPLKPLLDRALKENQAYADQFGVHLVLAATGLDVQVSVDDHRLQQVLSNLLSNAAKFSPPQGRIWVAVLRREGLVRVSVRDEGTGIPEVFKARIFGKFAQADSTDSREKGGTGLGLAICRQLIEHMGGNIGFDSIEGQGATFWFELPVVG